MTTETAIRKALDSHRAGRFDEAAAQYDAILREHPRHATALHMLGAICHQRGDSVAAERWMRAAMEAGDRSGELWCNLGMVLTKLGRMEEARAALEEARRLTPDNPNLHLNLGLLEERLGRLGEAIAHWRHALSLDPGHSVLRGNLELAERARSLAGPRGIAAARSELEAIQADIADRPFRPVRLDTHYASVFKRLDSGFMVSYATNREDVLLARAFRGQPSGFWIDVGAHAPMHSSTTCHFSRHGWTGINIEPVQNLYDELVAARPADVNLHAAIGDRNGTVDFFETPGSQLSTLDPELAEFARRSGQPTVARRVRMLTLDTVIERHGAGRTIDFLKIDVEGWEAEVLAGIDLARWRPRALVIESVRPMTDEPTWQAWEPGVLAAGYALAHFDGVNRFYAPVVEPELLRDLSRPVTPLDRFVPLETVRLALLLRMLEEDGALAIRS